MIQIQKILASDGAANDQFGTSVAISTDASTILVGMPMDDDNGTDSGSAYVYARSGLQWILQAKLLASGGGSAGDEFGISVALSSNGDTAIVGAHLDDTAANNDRGRAYVYVRSGTTWTQQAILTATDSGNNDEFSISVTLSSDGNTALIGAYLDNTPSLSLNNHGSAYIFTRSGTVWTQQAKLTASDLADGDRFGVSVALSADGDTALIGSYLDNTTPTNNHGSAYVFERSGTTWTQQQKLIASDFEGGDRFGISVDLSADGNTALVGAYRDDIASQNRQGSAYAFTRSGTVWTQQAKLIAGDGVANDEFGISVSLSSSGDIALVGGFLDDVVGNDQGSAYIFYRSGTVWTQQQKILVSDGAANDNFGNSVSLSGGGQVAVVGSILDDDLGNASGSAYIFAELIQISDVSLCCNPIKSDCSFCVCFQLPDTVVRQKLINFYISDVFQMSNYSSDSQRMCYQLTSPSSIGDFQVKIQVLDVDVQSISDMQTQTLYVRAPTCPSYLSGYAGLPFTPVASGAITMDANLSDVLDRIFVQHQLVSCTNNCCSSFVLDIQSNMNTLIGFLDRSDLEPGSAAFQLRQLISSNKPMCC